MTDKKWRWGLIAVTAFVLLILIAVVIIQFRPGIRVTIQNTGTTTLRSVVLHVTGATYNIGDIAPSESAAVRVRPTGESQLEIEITNADGQVQRLNAGGYFESGYRGTIRVSIKDGTIDENEPDIRLW